MSAYLWDGFDASGGKLKAMPACRHIFQHIRNDYTLSVGQHIHVHCLQIRGAKIVFDVDDPFFPPTVITIRGTVDEKASEEQVRLGSQHGYHTHSGCTFGSTCALPLTPAL